MEEKHPLNRTKEVSVDVVPSVDANNYETIFMPRNLKSFRRKVPNL
jgi:hypothetical protein